MASPSPEAGTLLTIARELRHAAQRGALPRTLSGKHLCLLGTAPASVEATAFREAAQELGARVTMLDPARMPLDHAADVDKCGRMLGRLYSAVECEGLASSLVDRLGASAGVPVYDGLALDGHPTAALRTAIDDEATADERRRRVLQAVLLSALT